MTDSEINILGVSISLIEPFLVDKKLEGLLASKNFKYIVTVNPDFLVTASQDHNFRSILQSASLATADGTGIIIMAKLLGYRASFDFRLTGVELTSRLLKKAVTKNLSVAVIIPDDAYSSPAQIGQGLNKFYPNLNFKVLLQSELEYSGQPLGVDIVFVTLGSPYQEKWIRDNQGLLADSRLALGVGGTFDYISGRITRAPKIFRSLGLEWLWRFFKRPIRMLNRVIRAVIIFPWLAWRYKK